MTDAEKKILADLSELMNDLLQEPCISRGCRALYAARKREILKPLWSKP